MQYSVVMLIGIGLAVAGIVMVNRENVKDNIVASVKTQVEKLFRDVSKNVKSAITFQETLECCGAVDYNDWNKLANQFPASCCAKRDSKSCKDPFRESVTSSEAKELYHDVSLLSLSLRLIAIVIDC